MIAGLILEALVALLLMITIGYCFVLNRRLSALRDGRDELKGLIETLSETVARAQFCIGELKKGGEEATSQLQESISKANGLSDELSVMIEVGNNLADRLADAAASRGKLKSGTKTKGAQTVAGAHDQQLLRILREAR